MTKSTFSFSGAAMTLVLLVMGAVAPATAANVEAPKLMKQVNPIYPQTAKQAGIQGTARFAVVINKDGRVSNIQPVSGHPLLIPAAVAAIRQWVYSPATLDGAPVNLPTEIEINFGLRR